MTAPTTWEPNYWHANARRIAERMENVMVDLTIALGELANLDNLGTDPDSGKVIDALTLFGEIHLTDPAILAELDQVHQRCLDLSTDLPGTLGRSDDPECPAYVR